MNLSFVPASQEDIEPLFQLNKDLIDRYEDTASIDYDRVLQWVRSNIRQNLSAYRRVMLDDTPAGYFALSPVCGKWELDSLFVLSSFQRRGIGTQILRSCIRQSDGNLFLYVFQQNTGAVRLYRKLGFTVTREAGKTRWIMEYQKQGC